MRGLTTSVRYPLGVLVREKNASLSVTLRCGIPKERSVYRLSGLSSRLLYGVHNNNRTNIVRAVMERVFFVTLDGVQVRTPLPAADAFDLPFLTLFRKQVVRGSPVLTRVTYEQFVGMYTGRRKAVFERAWQSLCIQGVCKRDAGIKAFVKAEKVKLTKDEWDFFLDPAPRLIQPRDPRYNVELGRFIKPLERPLYEAISRVWGGPTVMKGYNADETGEHLATMSRAFGEGWCAVPADAKRFDQHVSATALKYEHSFYAAFYRDTERLELLRLLSWQLRNTGRAFAADGKVTYTVPGNRMSGDMNTALGNCVLMCAMIWAFCKERNIPARLANNGDDCVTFMPRRFEARYRAEFPGYMAKLGFTMVMEPTVYELEKVEFCQANPVMVGDGKYRMVRNPAASLAKDATSVLGLTCGSMLQQHLTTLGQCGLALNSGVPILQSYFSALIRAGGGVQGKGTHSLYENGMFHLARRMSAEARAPTPQTRVSFYRAFGITPDDQLRREAWYDDWTMDIHKLHPIEYCLDHSVPQSLSTHIFNYGT